MQRINHDPDPMNTRMMAFCLALILILGAINVHRAAVERDRERVTFSK